MQDYFLSMINLWNMVDPGVQTGADPDPILFDYEK